MSPKREERILKGLLKALDAAGNKRKSWKFLATTGLVWLGSAALFFVVFHYGGPLRWPHYLLAIGAFTLGVGFAYDLYKSMFHEQWPVMAHYVDREQVERRLEELRT